MKKLLFLLVLFSVTMFSQQSFEPVPEGMVLIKGPEKIEIQTNHPILDKYLEEWKSSAKTFNDPNQIDYEKIFKKIKSVTFQDLPLSDYWALTESGEIYINIRYLEFPHLARVMTYQAIGYVSGLDFEKKGRMFMSTTWIPTEKEDGFAKRNSEYFTQERIYFGKLAKKYPIQFYHKI